MTVLPLYMHPVRALWAREQSSASKYWINTWGRTDLILAYWLFCGCASNSTKRLFWRLYRLFCWLFTIYRNAPCLTPKFCTIVVAISRTYYSRPKEIENNGNANFWEVKRCVMVHVKMVSSWFSIEVNRIQKRKELSVLLRFYFHEAMF